MQNNEDPTEDRRDKSNDPDRTMPDRNRSSGDEHFSADDSNIGSRIGRYLLQEKIGQGAFGVVYCSKDEMLSRQVAIKVLTRFSTSSQADAWVLEARVLANLDHPSIVPVYDIGKTDQGLPYIVSKLIDGGNLAVRSSKSNWTMDDSIRIVTQLAEALVYLHQKGVMHRDIKPSNILTTGSGDAVLVDFGLALPEDSYGKGSRFVGTPAYMSPEQARYEGHRVDGRSDIYSLGVVFYELLTGSRPFSAKDQEELLECIRTLEVRPPRQLNSTVPKELERICLKSLSKRASDRYLTATDLVEDLVNWRSAYLGSTEAISVLRPTAENATSTKPNTTTVASEQSLKSLDIETVGVVPHGLRPFGQNDADFFKHLVPGVRDRNGIPDSINFWIQRIESRATDLAFRIGVLMGPSGSGKSSFIRAGVLPQVTGFTQSVYLEARSNELENDLLKAVRGKYPQYAGEMDLRELLIRIRSNSNSQRPKLLIVIDQFEQWLNHHRDTQLTSLHEVLRQCDGINIQAIILARDDFLLGLSGFMEQLDESLLQNQNFATIEPFGIPHGRKVLAAFGRAFGVVNQPPTIQQEQFIHEAIDKLAETGRLQPVQIALLSDMLKSKPWTPSTLRELGGIQGLEIAFLEERLAGSGANPLLRGHLDLVQRILKELLPTDGTVIKPPACAHSVLIERLKGVASEELLTKLLHLIDTEVRLITPSSRASESHSGSTASSASDPAYQLTHDHLVITIRRWLNSRSLSTRAGRAAEQLHEISAMWNAKPSPKRLPSVLEWLAIRWLIPKSSWSTAESRMMRTARNRFSLTAAAACLATAFVLSAGFYWNRNRQAEHLVTRLLEAKSEEFVPVLREVDEARNWVVPKLDQLDSADPRVTNQIGQLRIAIAKLPQSKDAAEFVLDHLADVEEQHQVALVRYIAQAKPIDPELIAKKAEYSLAKSAPAAVAQTCLLCQQEPNHSAWPKLMPTICTELLRKPSGNIAFWPQMFVPIRQPLVAELLRTLESTQRQSEIGNRDLAAQNLSSLMLILANDDAMSLAKASQWSSANSVPALVQSSTAPNELSVELRLLLSHIKVHDIPTRISASVEATKLEETYSGRLFESGGWLEKVPFDKLTPCLEQLRLFGLGAQAARPYQQSGKWLVGLTLRQTSAPTAIEFGLNDDQLQQRFAAQQQAGFSLLDFAWYDDSSSESIPTTGKGKWMATWTHDPTKANSQVLLLGESNQQRMSDSRADRVNGLVQLRFQVRLEPNGQPRTDSLWSTVDYDVQEQNYWNRLKISAGDLYPGYLQADVRSWNTLFASDRGNFLEYVDPETPIAVTSRTNAGDKAIIASRLSNVGRLNDALELFNQIDEEQWLRIPEADRAEKRRTFFRHKGRCLARMQQANELQQLLEQVTTEDVLPDRDLAYFQLQVALIEKNVEQVVDIFKSVDPANYKSIAEREVLMRSLAAIASEDWLGELSNEALDLLIKSVQGSSFEIGKLQDSLIDIDFDKLRQNPKWRNALNQLGLAQRYSACFHSCDEQESHSVLGLSTSDHSLRAQSLVNEGYLPTIWHTHNEPNGEPLVSSVWVRSRRDSEFQQSKADQITSLILALGQLNELDALIDGLNEKWGRTVQTTLVEQVPRVLPSTAVIGLLKSSSEPKLQATILSVVGGYNRTDFVEADLRYLQLRLPEWAVDSKDIGILNMARFCAHRLLDLTPEIPKSQPILPGKNWFTNSLGQQFVAIKPPKYCLVGKMDDERRAPMKVGRVYAIATTEVTGRQFADFHRDTRFQNWMLAFRQRRWVNLVEPELPQNAISWLVALQYCQWLNEQEKIPEDQWCYKNVWGEEDGWPIPVSNYLNRTGYRLPTHAEWEWACCAESPHDIWSFGSSPRQSTLFEWTIENSLGKLRPCSQLRPNALGIFDMGGNLSEWTDDYDGPLLRSPYEPAVVDEGNNKPTKSSTYRILAGGRFKMDNLSATTSSSILNPPESFSSGTGMRLAKTLEVIVGQ